MVGAYRFSVLTYAIAKTFKLVNVPFFTLPNLLTVEPLVPEFLQAEATVASWRWMLTIVPRARCLN